MNQFSRTERLLGKKVLDKLANSHIAVFGIGGVGSFTTEALARCGVGEISLIDNDCVCKSNINRQLIALHSTLGKAKVDVMRDRILDINPDAIVHTHKVFFDSENADTFHFAEYDYIVDAIDTVSAKLELVVQAQMAGVQIISCMGAGNKLNPNAFEITDIYKTSVCPLARVMRRELRARRIDQLKVVYSKETPVTSSNMHITELEDISFSNSAGEKTKRQIPGSISFVPSAAGLLICGEVIRDIAQLSKELH